MGNTVFRAFLEWLRHEMRTESFKRMLKAHPQRGRIPSTSSIPGWLGGIKRKPYYHKVRSSEESLLRSILENGDINDSIERSNEQTMFASPSIGKLCSEMDKLACRQLVGNAADSASNSDEEFRIGSIDENTIESDAEYLWELAEAEGEMAMLEWLESNIWTYVGLSAPLLGALGPLRYVTVSKNNKLYFYDCINN